MARRHGSTTDPLWYKDAIIYELHVRTFKDSNGDGVGDFPGLIEKLDYVQDLGVTCLWLLPFFPSPLKDDGYDIADYLNVHPAYGTLDDFQNFMTAAHDRGLQVVIELVINHTSDQHPWFQAARHAPHGSPERDFYVWSDSDQKYRDVRVIFSDTEKSNWTWDPVAKAYYWHRFFSHQPDLNYDNPQVIEEVLKVMRFWLDRGVDGLRCDAIPFLVEREGTKCESLPETHAVVRTLRREIDLNYPGRMLLAEVNQWPADVLPYFGNGDEFHMAFHFPLMPRIYMALRQEDRLPITDIIMHTPGIPETCQWALFLRNHDELTLEMMTSDERDYMYLAYSADPRMRLNLGIRRRLAPLLDNNRRRIELLVSLLFSLPGAPVIYYGDEIGMGDNIYLGDRNGVRTPMQWSGDRNAGFSSASPTRLYSPVIMDPVWGYQAINVEAQQGDPSSLLTWMRNMIALRKLFRLFGRGSIEFLDPANRKVLAYLRTEGDDHVLCVANLSRLAQPVDLDLSKMEGMVPVEMLGYVEFPPITQQPYRVTLAPYGFLWLELHAKPQAAAAADLAERSPLVLADDWQGILEGSERSSFEMKYLVDHLPKQRWFAPQSRQIKTTRVLDWAVLEPLKSALAIVEVQYSSGPSDRYLLPLGANLDEQAAEELRRSNPNSLIAPVTARGASGLLHDALFDDAACNALLAMIEKGREIPARNGRIRGVPGPALRTLLAGSEFPLQVRRMPADQNNTSIVYADRLMLKLFRRLEEGENPDCEIGKYLTDVGFDCIPPFAGSIEYLPFGNGNAMTLAMLQGLVANEGDGWKWTIEELDRYYEVSASQAFPENAGGFSDVFKLAEEPPSQLARDHVGIYLDAAATLGRRTAEMHLALASPTKNPSFSPEPLAGEDVAALVSEVRQNASAAFDTLRERVPYLADEVIEIAASVLTRRRRILQRMEMPDSASAIRAQKTRIHGDYRLGQVLRVKTDFVILDFEGDPARSLVYRRSKHNALKDVAGMMRSFSYAAYASLIGYIARHPDAYAKLEPWANLWERSASAEFLRAYWQACDAAEFLPRAAGDRRWMLEVFLIDKVFHELLYELNSRPAWVRIPLIGIGSLQL